MTIEQRVAKLERQNRQQMTASEILLMVFAFTVAFLLVKLLLRDAPEWVRDIGNFSAILATMRILIWFGVLRSGRIPAASRRVRRREAQEG